MEIQTINCEPFDDQRPGTSGLRKKTSVFMQEHYLECFVQSALNVLKAEKRMDLANETIVLGGDGRFYNREAINIITRILVANNVGAVLIGQGGIISTPAMSAIIRGKYSLGGFILSASHNPGGENGDFGIKYNISNGGPAPEEFTEGIFKKTKSIHSYQTISELELDLDTQGSNRILNTNVVIIDPLEDYLKLLQEVFDFDQLREYFQEGGSIRFDAMNAVTGPYAKRIFEDLLGAKEGSVIRATPMPDFGGLHPDPNLVHAAELVETMFSENAPALGAASDGDGDRNLVLGENIFISPGDSLAAIAEHAADCIPGYKEGLKGVARSMPTSRAVDRVAEDLGINCFETPTGWKFFGSLLDADLATICGEESFGTSSNHVREKDGIWAVLCWLSIIASTRKSVTAIMTSHWKKFGRSYFQRHDYEELAAAPAKELMDELRGSLSDLEGSKFATSVIETADDFRYVDPVDGSSSYKQGYKVTAQRRL